MKSAIALAVCVSAVAATASVAGDSPFTTVASLHVRGIAVPGTSYGVRLYTARRRIEVAAFTRRLLPADRLKVRAVNFGRNSVVALFARGPFGEIHFEAIEGGSVHANVDRDRIDVKQYEVVAVPKSAVRGRVVLSSDYERADDH